MYISNSYLLFFIALNELYLRNLRCVFACGVWTAQVGGDTIVLGFIFGVIHLQQIDY